MSPDQDYRHGLSAEELVPAIRRLLATERTALRLTCRYLADLADRMDGGEEGDSHGEVDGDGGDGDDDGDGGADGGALAGYSDVYHAARCLFGLGTHTTRERIRVGRALRSLPRIEEALRSGDISYSAAREVTRVATVEDESTWIQLARELPIRALERRVVEAAGRGPRGRADEGAQLRWSTPETVEVTLRLPAETWALLQRAMEGARRASEASLIEAEALSAVARDALARQNTEADGADPRRTVVLYECQSCARTEIDTGAGAVELGAEAAATLGCGARVRDLRTEGRVVRRGGPLPAAIERAVRLRDRNRCRVPGCFRRRYVDVHHLTFQSEGGEHSRSNCVCLCTTHHARLHDGRLRIEGDAEGELMFHDATGAPLSWPAASHGGTAEAAMPATSHGRTSATPPASHGGRAEAAGGTAEAAGGTAEAAGGTAARLVALMGRRGGWSVDSLVEASGLGVGELQGALLTLELDGHVEFDGRGGYAPRELVVKGRARGGGAGRKIPGRRGTPAARAGDRPSTPRRMVYLAGMLDAWRAHVKHAVGSLVVVLGLVACSGDPELSSGPGSGGSGGAQATGAGWAGGSSSGGGGLGGDGGTGGTGGQGGTGGACEPGGFAPQPEPYPVTIAGQKAWVHDEGFSSGYFHTYDELTLPGPDERPRKVHVFLPRDYTESCDRYPVVYMNDGETTFWPGGPGNKSWSVAQGLEGLYSEGAIPPVMVVAVHAIDRNYEYSHTPWAPDVECCGVESYADYLADGVKGFIDANYRTAPEPEKTAIVGSSRGGLCSFVVASLRPDSFRKAGCLSPSFWLGLEPVWGGDFPGGPLATSKLLDMTKGTLSDPGQKPTLWIDWGLVFTGGFHNEVIEKNAAEYGQEMVTLLQADYGYSDGQDLFWMEDPAGEHDEISWAKRFPFVMKALFGEP